MASLHSVKTNNGVRYRVRWRGENARNRSQTFTADPQDQFEAQRLLAGLLSLEAKQQPGFELDLFHTRFMGELRKRRQKPLTVGEVVRQQIDAADVKDSTRKRMGEGMVALKPLWAVQLDQLTVRQVDSLVRAKAVKAPSQAHKALGLLKRSLRKARMEGQQFDDAILDVPLPRLRPRPLRALTVTEVELLAHKSTEPNVIWFLALTGLRVGEMAALRDEHLHLDHLHPYMDVPGTKTDAADRQVYLTAEMVDVLERQLADRAEGCRWVFPSESGVQMHLGNFRKRVFAPAVEAAGLAPLKPHSLRATNATWRMDAGTPDHELADQMGWSAPYVARMREIYVKTRIDHRVSAAGRLDGFVSKARESA